jgi:hypothetical protein
METWPHFAPFSGHLTILIRHGATVLIAKDRSARPTSDAEQSLIGRWAKKANSSRVTFLKVQLFRPSLSCRPDFSLRRTPL